MTKLLVHLSWWANDSYDV